MNYGGIMRIAIVLLTCLLLAGCGKINEDFNRQFGDQHFKTAIALIELHKIRYGQYPGSLSDLKYTGGWDGIATGRVEYKKLPEGYRLDLVGGWSGKPETLAYPDDFWNGLGLRESNMKPEKSSKDGVVQP